MPRLACWSCGRVVYASAPIDALLPEERRCPRCGALMNRERREAERRLANRRAVPPAGSGPPDGVERREADRRSGQRRRANTRGGAAAKGGGRVS